MDPDENTDYDIAVRTVLLPGLINKQLMIDFLNQNHQTSTGNTTLITEDNFNSLCKVGTLCSYIMKEDLDKKEIKKDGDLVGIFFNTLVTISVSDTIAKSCYSTYLCVSKEYRRKNYSRFLVDASDRYCKTMLKTNTTYFLNYKDRGQGILIKSFYRVLNYSNMKEAGFKVMTKPKNKIKTFYHIKKVVGPIITSGINAEITNRNFDIYWCPFDSEKDRFSSFFNFRTVQYERQSMVFSIFPLKCLINKTGETVNIAMLSYFYSSDPNLNDTFFKIVVQIAEEEGYDCVYGYILGDITEFVTVNNSCHITDNKCYLNFYGINKDVPQDISKINLLIY